MPGFVSGIAGGLLFMELGTELVGGGFWALLVLVNVEAPATSKIAVPVAKSLQRLLRREEYFIIDRPIVKIAPELRISGPVNSCDLSANY